MSIRNGLLSLLEGGPKYGFQLKKEFEELTGEFWPLNVGQVYTTLGRLVRDGLATEDGTDDAGQRRYRISEDGRREVAQWFDEPRSATTPERDELVIKVATAVALGRPGVEQVLQIQRREATAALQTLTRRKARLEPGDLSQSIVIDALIARLDAEVRWLDLTGARLATTRKDHR